MGGIWVLDRSLQLGVFEFIIVLVLISTIGKVLSRQRPNRELPAGSSRRAPGELEALSEALDDLSGRLGRLEEERDFYKALLDAPEQRREIRPADKDGPS